MVFRKKRQFSSKTVGVIFSPYRSQDQNSLTIRVDNLIVPFFFNRTKYLGVLLDSLVNMNNHVENILRSANQALNIMKCLAGKDWGADRQILILFYAAAVRSRIEYSFPVLMGISPKNFKKRRCAKSSLKNNSWSHEIYPYSRIKNGNWNYVNQV